MGMNMTEKIFARHAGLDKVVPGQLIKCKLDLVLGNDITSPPAITEFNKIGKPVFDKNKIALVPDHFTPNKDIKSAQMAKIVREFARKHEIVNYFEVGQMGIEHVILPEKGLVAPGDLIIGADSHTCTYGAVGAFATGVGSTDMGAAMATGETWFKVPAAIKVELTGIVPLLQSNTINMSNPTAIIINKDVNNKDVDNIVDNNAFNGGEIIDRLEALISKPVELGDSKVSNLTLISDYQTLLESLGAAAAGGQAGGNTTANGSTFNSIFSIVDGGLNGIAATDRWVNLTESISTIPVDTGNTTAIAQSIVTPVNVNLIGVNTSVIEGENATYKVTLTDDLGNPVLAVEDITPAG